MTEWNQFVIAAGVTINAAMILGWAIGLLALVVSK